jgi:hypothetical protein
MTKPTHTFYRDDFSVYGSPEMEGGSPGWIVSVNDGKALNIRFWVSGEDFHEIEDRDIDPKGFLHKTIIGRALDGVPDAITCVVHDAIRQWKLEIEGRSI